MSMWYSMMSLFKNSLSIDMSLVFTYIDDGSYALEEDVYLVDADTGEVVDSGTTDIQGSVIFSSVPTSSYKIIIRDVLNNPIDTLYANTDTQKSYQIVKESNIKDGQLYDGYVAQSGNIAPSGWHVPTEAEIDTLLNNYVDSNDAYTALIEGGSSGFEAKLSGLRSHVDGSFGYLDQQEMIAVSDSNKMIFFNLNSLDCVKGNDSINTGKSIRLVRDTETGWNEGDIVTDLDDNIYNTVKIGNQVWTVQNWACTQYNDGTPIPNTRLNDDWAGLSSGAYCAFNNNSQNVFIDYQESNVLYGRLYNWYAVDNAAGLAPAGLKVPTNTDMTTLISYLTANGFSGVEAIALKSISGWNSGGNGTDDFEFTALPVSKRSTDGTFPVIGNSFYIWSSTEFGASNSHNIRITTFNNTITIQANLKEDGYSIRMLADPSGEYAVDGAKYTDPDGNVYDVVQIGTQFWLAQNWACTKYADGSTIPEITDNTNWSNDATGARCSYNNSESEYVFK